MDGRQLSYAGDELDQLAVAYAVTVHKAQGSEYPAVVVPLLRQHGRMLRRNLLYTAITRARRLVVLLTEPDALERAVRDTSDLRRTTLLRQRLTNRNPAHERPGTRRPAGGRDPDRPRRRRAGARLLPRPRAA